MSALNGTRALLLLDDVAFDAQINGSVNIEKDLLETTVKATTRGKTFSGDGEYGTTVDLEVLYDPAATLGAFETLAKLKAGTLGVLKFGETTSGGKYLQVSGFAQSMTFNLSKNEIGTVPVSFQGSGEITTGTVSP